MSTLRFNRLHFFKKFNPQAEYVVLKDMVLGGVEIKRGDVLDKSLLPMHKIKRLFETRKITPDYSLYDRESEPEIVAETVEEVTEEIVAETVEVEETPLTTDEKRDIVMPEVVQAGPAWKKVMLGKEQIGKSVRTDEEAQAIIDEWLDEQTK